MINLSFPGIIPLRRRNYEPSLHSILYFNTQIVIFTASTNRENQTVDISNNKKKLHGFESCLSYFLVLKNLTWYFFCWLNPVRKWIPINYLHMTQKIHMHKIFKKKKKEIPVLVHKSGIICIFLLFLCTKPQKINV